MQYKTRRKNNDFIEKVKHFSQQVIERYGDSQIDSPLLVAELGLLLHEKKFFELLENCSLYDEETRERMTERAKLLKDSRQNATKQHRKDI